MNSTDIFHVPAPGGAAIGAITGLDSLSRAYARIPRREDEPFFQSVQRAFDLRCEVSDGDRARIPASGPVIVVANHPFGAAEGIVLASILGGIRSDVKVMANHLLGRIPEFHETLILVDPFNPGANASNIQGMRRALAHLHGGGMLIVFPAGAVSHWQPRHRGIADPPWSPAVARLARKTKASVLPVYFPGSNGPLFQLAGLVHPTLRTALLPKALLDRRHTTIEMRIGSAIPSVRLARFDSDEAMTAHLRRLTYVLAHRQAQTPRVDRTARQPIAPAIARETLAGEIASLPANAHLAANGDLEVFLATADQIPNVLLEIGRLREITFRGAGEGSGKARDLDSYDAFYRHLFVWNRATNELVGAYRLGLVDEIVERYGSAGLYTSTLFRYSSRFFEAVGRASVEMGRSFVRPEYQKSFSPLLLLWKGIGAFVSRNPKYCVLFGPASISNDFHPQSRGLLARYLMERTAAPEIAPFVTPRRRFRQRPDAMVDGEIAALEDLQEMIAGIEAGQRTVPVLLRQYLSLGGRVAALNVDPDFSEVLDALVLVDLRRTDEKTLGRYMGNAEMKAFRALHGR
ncbi:MAG: lysophospholipid acyltransferase family protein [Acidobacteria bacterium]|nr:lysophospholipid acyltransferase family protein [Acidobacteriota bacterium]